tara:strand:+ start:325 stop:540 length:216 start_codon:yes stop_codon:yes gene_type:complete
MKIKKITTGFVIQEYDAESGEWISQEFIAGDLVEWEDENGECVDSVDDAYLPFDMIQPPSICPRCKATIPA